MTNQSKLRRVVAILTVTAVGGLTTWVGAAGAHTEPGPFKIRRDFQQAVVVDDPIHINMRRGTEVTTTSRSSRAVTHPGTTTPGLTSWRSRRAR